MPSAARRLTALLSLLGVLLGTLGWGHLGCGLRPTTAAAATAAVQGAGHDAHCDPAGAPSRAPAPDRHGTPDGCAWVAHCVTWTPAPVVLAAARALPPAHAPRPSYRSAIPLAPDTEPESPPPRG